MLTWILYVLVITLLLSAAALAAEYAARLRRARTRWIWVVTIVASLAIPTLISTVSIQLPSLLAPTVSRRATALRELTRIQVVPLTWVHEHTRLVAATRSENRFLQRTWIAVSAALLAALALNALYVSARERRWKMGAVSGVPVYIAPEAGPAVVGLLRPRIVVPAWLPETSPSHQAMVMAHEQAHLAGRDQLLLTVALCLVVLMPWNLPLWWQLHRLRYAIEVDCDARVLESGLDSRVYGEMLIDVSERPSAYIGAVAAMAESRSFLEERITLMMRDPAKWGSLATVTFGSLALALVAVASQVTPPNVGNLAGSDQGALILTPAVLDRYVGFYVRGANMVVPVTRVGTRLRIQAPGYDPEDLAPDSYMHFVSLVVGLPITFIQDARGETTGFLLQYGEFSIPHTRIDASVARKIMANNAARYRSQTPAQGSAAMMRRVIDGLHADKPNYEEMVPWFAELCRQTQGLGLQKPYVQMGAVQSIEFRGVEFNGGDVYEVRQEGGTSTWAIWLDSNGLIEDALNWVW
jgi:beta-lactamase regulating signal transducer with metallopeptidase domain